ncbi:hypothetical protein HNQ56_002733 [Anaerotaenia torta]|uniref:hypothetical protein n=1 Tax=Anaerotaenia torta TaxID=433293 RepID=UPI003D2472BF
MKKNINIKLLILILLLFSICIIVSNKTIVNKKNISMIEAYKIAIKAACEKSPNILLASIISTDDSLEKENNNAGNDGIRKYWNFEFAVPNSSEHWFVSIRENRVEDVVKVTGIPYDKTVLIDKDELKMDSNEALDIAKSEYILEPGAVWAIGYHFSISKENGKILLDVICRDHKDRFTKISIDVREKQISEAIHKVFNGGGIFNGNDNKAIIDNYDVDGITNKDNKLFAWGKKMINIIQYEPMILYKKENEDNWNELKANNDIRNIIPINENNFFAICDKNIYNYDSKNIVNEIELSENILASIYFMDKLYILTKSQLHISSDKGESWNIILLPKANDITNISLDFNKSDHVLYISIDNKIYGFNREWIEVVDNDDIINDFKYINNSIIYTTNKSIIIYSLESKDFRFIDKIFTIKKLIRYDQAFVYAITDEGKLFKIKKEEGDKNDWIVADCNIKASNGLISDVLQIDKNKWYYSAVSKPEWEKLKKGE